MLSELPLIELAVLAAVLLVGGIALVRRSRGDGSTESLPDLHDLTRRSRHEAYAVLLVFFGLAGGWSVLAPLESAAIAEGVVTPEGSRRSVQHLEGGIIRAIHVVEGQQVAAGDPLVTLENVAAQADHTVLNERYLHLTARVARLVAEQSLAAEVSLPPELARDRVAPTLWPAVEAQLQLFKSRRNTLEARRQVLDQKILQLQEENAGLREAIAGQDRQFELIEREISGTRELLEKGLERLPRLLSLQRAGEQVRIDRAQNRARIARNKQEIGGALIEKASLEDDWRGRAGDELVRAREALAEAAGRLPETRDALDRTVARAPLAGTVLDLALTTLGGVVGPGERMLDIVPADADLLIDARVQPQDIESIHPGLEARVILSAYSRRNMATMTGRVRTVSADRLVDERSGAPFYLAKIEIDHNDLTAVAPAIELVPGMPAEVMIATGERTFFDYLFAPLMRSFDQSFRES